MSFAAVVERLRVLQNPYPGLRPFDVDEAHLFFGRDQQIAELVRRLERHRFVAVLGVSGSGKSSLVRAGLLPALERGGLVEAGRRWRRVVTQPAGAPYESLAVDLARARLDASPLRASSYGLIHLARQLPPDESLLLVVDQFEELFRYKDLPPITEAARRTRQRLAADAAEFVQLLLAASRHYPPIYVVITMRTDYLGDCAEFRDLPETLNDCQYLVPRMSREERKEAIEGPLGDVRIDSSLVQRLLNDAGDEPDQLPVLQHALMRTWSHWRNTDPHQTRRVQLQDYELIGGFEEALNRHADDLAALVPGDITACIFKRLTARGRSHRERRDPATLAELWAICNAVSPERRQHVRNVIDGFRTGDATFLRPRTGDIQPDTYIDITHESLIRLWKKLRDEWLPEEQRSARTLLDLAARAGNWTAGTGEPLGGRDLDRIEQWERERNQTRAWAHQYVDETVAADIDRFLAASHAARRWRRLRRRALSTAVVLLVLAGTGWFMISRFMAQQQELARTQDALVEAARASQALERQADDIKAVTERETRDLQTELVANRAGYTEPGPTVSTQKPRLYVQVRSKDAREGVRGLEKKLQAQGVLLPRPQILDTGPAITELRYFRKDEQPQAEKIQQTVQQEIGYARLTYVEGFESSDRIRDNHFELWIAPADVDATLVRQLNDPAEQVRKAAGGQLARDYRSSPQAVGLVLDTLSERSLPSLSASGLINALYFLNRSDLTVWTDEHKKRAREAIGRIRASGGKGPQTAEQLNSLERKLYLY